MKFRASGLLVVICAWTLWIAHVAAQDAPSIAPAPATAPTTKPAPASRPSPDQEMVSISFRDAPVDQLFIFISDKTGKPVIPQDSVKQKRITVVSSKQRTLSEAMQIIAEALRQNGIVMEESPRVINMKSLSDAKQSLLQVIPPETSVKTIQNKAQVVHKLFELKYFDVAKMKDVVMPMLPDFGHIIADPNTRRLMVTDTVEDLERIEQLINSLDVSQADQTIKKIIAVKQGDAADIVATVRVLIASSLGSQARDVLTGGAPKGAGPSAPKPPSGSQTVMTPDGSMTMTMGGPSGPNPSGSGSASNSDKSASAGVFVEENKAPVVLLADVSRNWIIAVASTRVMGLIDEWVAKLDVPAEKIESQFDVLDIQHADMDEVSKQIMQTIDALPTGDARQSVRLVPFTNSRKILVSGSKRGREMVKDLLAQLDKESGNQQMRVFQLKYADAEEVAQDIENLYAGKQNTGYSPFYYFDSYSSRNRQPQTRVKVTADTRRNAVIVFSDTSMLDQIGRLLKDEWDLPLSETESQPKIYTLKHVDPVKLKEMLSELFFKKNRKRNNDSPFFFDEYLMDLASSKDDQPVGRLYGQFRFQAMPDSNRLLVVAKNSANYSVMDSLIAQLDQPEDAGLPQMVELKHANAEDLAEQLNATLAEPGTLAEILRAKRELGPQARQNGLPQSSRTNENPLVNAQNQQQQAQNTNPNSMTFWWQRAQRRVDEQPTSNLIGKIRFVPIQRRNALLVVAPLAYAQPIKELVEQLDQPGLQVMIHAVIAEVQSEDTTTLGIRLASDPSIFKDPRLTDSSIGGGANTNVRNVLSGTPSNQDVSSSVFTGNININLLLQLLMRKFGLKILFEPKLFTADNQEAEFFDGQDVPFQTQAQSSPEGATVVQSFNYTAVGTFLRVRPHITNERDVDLTINLELSNIVPGQTTFGNFIFDRRETTTHVIMRDGETVMLSGIIRQQLSRDVRKLPFLGDIPLIGGFFRSTDMTRQNRELVAFITPHVIRREGQPAAASSYKDWIENLRRDLNPGMKPTTIPGDTAPAR
jgi:general secretion pathway protein D